MNPTDELRFNGDGLIPAVAQDHGSGRVLMLAWMNLEAFEKTLETGYAHYYSRSRQNLWKKGETSGHLQRIKGIYLDCDGDTLLLQVDQTGPACHTNRSSCFYRRFGQGEWETIEEPVT